MSSPIITVGDLIEVLQGYAPDHQVILSSDAEGNRHRPLAAIEHNAVYDGEESIGVHHLTPELEEEGFTEEDLYPGDPVIVLYPS